jgi:acyl carrier protein
MNINNILFNICQDVHVYNDDFDLIESGVMDSYALIELFSIFEENDIFIESSKINIENLRTPGKIKELIYEKNTN